jgi:hypothetical protein
MAKAVFSTKRLQIDKANARIVVIIALASVLTTFSLVASKALLDQRAYQARVITEKKKAADQLKQNLEAVDRLKNSYTQFIGAQENIIGGNSVGLGAQDGDNGKIILDALPSKYDFPALTSSVEKILADVNISFDGIGGTDDEITQLNQSGGPTPQPIEIPFSLSVRSDPITLAKLVTSLELSIRPMHITSMSLVGNDMDAVLDLNIKTYYQPATSLDITTKDVR